MKRERVERKMEKAKKYKIFLWASVYCLVMVLGVVGCMGAKIITDKEVNFGDIDLNNSYSFTGSERCKILDIEIVDKNGDVRIAKAYCIKDNCNNWYCSNNWVIVDGEIYSTGGGHKCILPNGEAIYFWLKENFYKKEAK